MYSPEQREWLFKELEDSMKYDFVIWMSTPTLDCDSEKKDLILGGGIPAMEKNFPNIFKER